MSFRAHIVLMSWFAVLSDAVLIGFYPQFFAQRFGESSALHTGAYIAFISIAVMCTLPLWARVARRVDTLRLLVGTQFVAGALCAASFWAESLVTYWVLSLLMFMVKSSYLLMYPCLMRAEPAEQHAKVIGILSVVVHVGGILGAVVGGWVMQRWGTGACLWVMAAGDFAQMAMCVHLLRTGRVPRARDEAPAASAFAGRGMLVRVLKIGVVMLMFDFSAYLIRPFFSQHWEQVSGISVQWISGLVFAIPGMIALAALAWNHRARHTALLPSLPFNLALGAAGMLLQAAPWEPALLAGRLMYGWALFQGIVTLETRLFQASTPAHYASHYGIANAFQNMGVLLSSFAAGALAARFGAVPIFVVAAAGLVITGAVDRLFRARGNTPHASPASTPLGVTNAL